MPKDEVQDYIDSNNTIEYAHTLEDQIQGQIDAGLIISGFYEDDFGGTRIIDKHIKTFIATKAIKLNHIRNFFFNERDCSFIILIV